MNLKILNYELLKNNKIKLEISWEKSWRNEINCDGVWIFGKYRSNTGIWKHIDLKRSSQNEFDYTDQTPQGNKIGKEKSNNKIGMWVPTEKKGVFIYRTEGSGDVHIKDIVLDWDYEKTDLNEETQIKIMGVEMVYIPEGAHYIGDPEGEKSGLKNCFFTYPDQGAYLIKSEDEVRVAKEEGALYCNQDTPFSRDEVPFVIPQEFPKGKKAFWYMKYSLTMKQYVDFLNLLTRKQQQSRVLSDISKDEIPNYYVMTNTSTEYERQAIIAMKKGNGTEESVKFYTNAPQRGCNAMSWSDVTSFAAWAGLRPATELEYEKAARGTADPISKEFAWGTTRIGRVEMFSGADGSGTEIKLPESGVVNCNFGCGIAPFERETVKEPRNPGFIGPVSVGLFSNSIHTGVNERENSGASFYGAMELSGNLWKQCVTIGNINGRKYKGTHGSGELDEYGYAKNPDWPDKSGEGAGVRGGVFVSPDPYYVIMALRAFAAHTNPNKRYHGGCHLAY